MGGFVFREPEGTKVVETDFLEAAPTDYDEVNIGVQKGSGTKDTSGPFSIVNPPISGAAPKPISSNMDSRYFLPTKTPSFASSNVYPPISLNFPALYGGGIKSKPMTSSLSGEVYSSKLVSFSFGSPVRSSAVSKPIFDIKFTEDRNNISTPIISVSGRNFLSFGSLAKSASPKSSGGGFADYSSTSVSGRFKFG